MTFKLLKPGAYEAKIHSASLKYHSEVNESYLLLFFEILSTSGHSIDRKIGHVIQLTGESKSSRTTGFGELSRIFYALGIEGKSRIEDMIGKHIMIELYHRMNRENNEYNFICGYSKSRFQPGERKSNMQYYAINDEYRGAWLQSTSIAIRKKIGTAYKLFGTYIAEDSDDALNAMARDGGYKDFVDLTGSDDKSGWLVEEVTSTLSGEQRFSVYEKIELEGEDE
jgi:hypothetical protein